jgi:uncharacterized protein (TIGR02099 family)
MLKILKTLIRYLPVAGGCGLILVAIAIGGFRILATQIPSYQSELEAWAREELSLELRFDRVDLRWGILGPELTFFDATIATEDPREPFLLVREAVVSLDPMSFVTSLRFSVNRLVFEGIRITVARTQDGAFYIDGAGNEGINFDFELPPEVELIVRDSQVVYEDRMLGLLWPFEQVTINAIRGRDSLTMNLSAVPPPALGDQLQLSLHSVVAAGSMTSHDWSGFASLGEADLASIAQLSPWNNFAEVSGSGDVSVWAQVSANRLTELTLDVRARNVLVSQGNAASQNPYEELDFSTEWTRVDRGWQLAMSNTRLRRDGREWLRDGETIIGWQGSLERADSISLSSDFLRLSDLTPFVELLPPSELREQWLALDPRGDVRDVEFGIEVGSAGYEYQIQGDLQGLGFSQFGRLPGITGLVGQISADTLDGRMSFAGPSDVEIRLPGWLPRVIEAKSLSGVLVWRQGRDAFRVVSDDLSFEVLGAPATSSLELTLPLDDSSAYLDLIARIGAFDIAEFKPFIPLDRMPRGVADWLERGIVAGDVESVDVSFFGAVDDFPFDAGEGQLHVIAQVTDGLIDYIDQWPMAADLDGTIEFVNAGFRARGTGRVLGNVSDNVDVEIPDMRDPILGIRMSTSGPLADVFEFLNTAPLISGYLGPSFARLDALAGMADVRFDLSVPLRDRPSYGLTADLKVAGGEIAVSGFTPHFQEINGVLSLGDGNVTGEGIEAIFLDGPVVARVLAPDSPGYRSVLEIDGDVTADAVLSVFELPYRELFAGQTSWHGRLALPSYTFVPAQPVAIRVASNLSGVAMRLPEPFAKGPGTATGLQLDFAFQPDGTLTVDGNVGASRRFATEYAQHEGRFRLRRGQVRFGGEAASLPREAGLVIEGTLPLLDLGKWLSLTRERDLEPSYPLLSELDLQVNDLSAFGQHLGNTAVRVAKSEREWEVHVDSEAIAGDIILPTDLSGRPYVHATMDRVYLQGAGETGLGMADPGQLPGIELTANEFGIGSRRLGRFEARISPDALGLRLDAFESRSDSFSASGSGTWLSGPGGAETRIAFSLRSENVAATLSQLGFNPLLEGELAEVRASLYWPGAPSRDWTEHVSGDIGLRLEDGAMLDIDPGAGRLVGLMSIMALPRRLALDFRDVFNRGFAFDEITGDFLIDDGNAYTDNLKLAGPAADIGVVGRTGLRDRDFHQQAVVTAEPSKMLPTVGGLIAGAGVGAALLIFTRIFKEPLRGIGRVSYCITGSWDEPVVERLTAEQLDQEALCAELPAELSLTDTEARSQ